MTDTNNTPNTNDPQDLINAALGTTTPSPAPEPSSEPQPTPELPATPSPTIETPVMPNELTEAPVLPTQVTMGDDTPLAFVGSTPASTSPTTEPVVEPTMPVSLGTSAPMDAVPPVVPISTLPVEHTKPKKSKLKVIGLVVALFVAFGVIGSLSYQMLTGESLIAILQPKGPVKDIDSEADCSGPSNGGWLVWRNGKCKVTGISGSEDKNNDGVGDKDTTNPILKNVNTKTDCQGAGGTWCEATDLNNKAYSFCNTTSGSGIKTCQNLASEKGFSVVIGAVQCKCKDSACTDWDGDHANIDYYWDTPGLQLSADQVEAKMAAEKTTVNNQCSAQYKEAGKVGFGQGSFICQLGKAGSGGVVYTGGACTAANGFPYNGGMCFCGTVQKDTPTGHTSYKSTCGCEKTVTNPSPSPSVPVVAPKLMCDGLTRTPTTTPVIGDKLTFTCTGSSVPAGSVSLTYKFRSAIDGGVWSSLTNKTATTAEMTINACGSYKIQCQACGTISGAVVCDPVWTGASAL